MIFKDIKGFEGLYKISDTGLIKRGEKILKERKNGGYNDICLSKDGKVSYHKIHRLVALTFIPNPENKPCVNHINCNKRDNHINNLEWVTYKENMQHAIKNNLCRSAENHKNSKLKNSDIGIIKYLKGKLSHSDIAYMFGITRTVITQILNNKAWIDNYKIINGKVY